MVKKFLWETNGTVPFKGQCFLLSDFLQWARNINGSEVLHFIINLFEKNNFEKSLSFVSSRMHPYVPSTTFRTCF